MALLSTLFSGYLLHTLLLVGVLRVVHGLAFGLMTTSSSTLPVDTMPVSNIGLGISIFGMVINIAMVLGPMIGMFLLGLYSFWCGRRLTASSFQSYRAPSTI